MPDPEPSKDDLVSLTVVAHHAFAEYFRRADHRILCQQSALEVYLEIMGIIGSFQQHWTRHGLH